MGFDLHVHDLASGGYGVGRSDDGMVFFVPRTVTGDLVRIEPISKKKNYGHARIIEVLKSGPARRTPPCCHYVKDDCGGCHFQHVQYSVQAQARATFVESALQRIGGISVSVEMHTAPREYGYRHSITLSANRKRNLFGYRKLMRPDTIFKLENCLIAAPELNQLFSGIDQKKLGSLLPAGSRMTLKMIPGNVDFVTADTKDHRFVIVLATPFMKAAHLRQLKRHVPHLLDDLAKNRKLSLWIKGQGAGIPRRVYGSGEAWETSFSQINPPVARELKDTALKYIWNHLLHRVSRICDDVNRFDNTRNASIADHIRLLDLYSGCGDISLKLAEWSGNLTQTGDTTTVPADHRDLLHHNSSQLPTIQLFAVESCQAASDYAANIAINCSVSAAPVEFTSVCSTAERIVHKLLPADIIIVNPPRTGCNPEVLNAIRKKPPEMLVYISCDPATLARDLKRLGVKSADIEYIGAWDMFPQTCHVETLVIVRP